MSFFLEPQAAGPVVSSRWDTIGPTHAQYNPDEYIQRAYGYPSEFRGQRFYQPVPFGADPGTVAATVPASHPTSQYLGLILLLAGVGLLAYYLGRNASGVKRNPGCKCPDSWLPRSSRRRRRLASKERTRRRRRACRQPRNEKGQFV